MTTALLEKEQTEIEPYGFTAHDRCDAKCSAQAYHRCTKNDLELLFCNHHFAAHQDKLLADGFTVESDVLAIKSLSKNHYIYSG